MADGEGVAMVVVVAVTVETGVRLADDVAVRPGVAEAVAIRLAVGVAVRLEVGVAAIVAVRLGVGGVVETGVMLADGVVVGLALGAGVGQTRWFRTSGDSGVWAKAKESRGSFAFASRVVSAGRPKRSSTNLRSEPNS